MTETTGTDESASDASPRAARGPLAGLRVVEIGGLGPGPFAAMLLSDLGADVVRVDRTVGGGLAGPNFDPRKEILNRGRRSIAVDLKHAEGAAVVLDLVERADVLFEGFRPGVAERLGIGPDVCLARNPRLIYGRMTGYGQHGPMAREVGHDINYVAMSGLLSLIGRRGAPPTPPLALAGDFGGGGMLLVIGILAALWERSRSGRGQVIDAAMVDGATILAAPFYGFAQTGAWRPERGTNLVDSGAPFYDAYECADGRYLSIGPLEPHFYADLLDLVGIDQELPEQYDQEQWAGLKPVFADAIRRRSRDEWLRLAEGRNACVAPVLDLDEAPQHPHHLARGRFIDIAGITQPAPAPVFSRTPAGVPAPPAAPGEHTSVALASWGIADDRIKAWAAAGVVADRTVGNDASDSQGGEHK